MRMQETARVVTIPDGAPLCIAVRAAIEDHFCELYSNVQSGYAIKYPRKTIFNRV